MARIIRVENAFGKGLYRVDERLGYPLCGRSAYCAADLIGINLMDIDSISDEGYTPVRPIPGEDGLRHNKGHHRWRYAFKDHRQLANWFENKVSPKDLLDLGLQIVIIEADGVEFGKHQCRYHTSRVRNVITVINPELKELYGQYAY